MFVCRLTTAARAARSPRSVNWRNKSLSVAPHPSPYSTARGRCSKMSEADLAMSDLPAGVCLYLSSNLRLLDDGIVRQEVFAGPNCLLETVWRRRSENIIEASWLALVDSFEYKLFKDEEREPPRAA